MNIFDLTKEPVVPESIWMSLAIAPALVVIASLGLYSSQNPSHSLSDAK